MKKEKKPTLAPRNQRSVYNSFAKMFADLMNNEIDIDKAETGSKILSGMNAVYANELKAKELALSAGVKINIDVLDVEQF